jgi:hypothetical protein
LPLPELVNAQVEWVNRRVADYIGRQREAYRIRGTPLDQNQKEAMQAFFPASTLDSARVLVLSGERVANPPFYAQLVQMGFEPAGLPNFALMAAITFVDTVVSHEPFADRLLFHELVHVVQYLKLGLEGFAVRYVNGFLSGGSYEAIPLEKNAYELDARFAAAPAGAFPVEAEVQKWIDWGMF